MLTQHRPWPDYTAPVGMLALDLHVLNTEFGGPAPSTEVVFFFNFAYSQEA